MTSVAYDEYTVCRMAPFVFAIAFMYFKATCDSMPFFKEISQLYINHCTLNVMEEHS